MLYEDGVSISRFKKRPIVLKESSDSAIDSEDESDALGAAVLSDLAWPKAEQSIEMLYFWPVELQDLYRFTANGVHYSVNEDLAVVRYKHLLGRNGGKEHRTLTRCARRAVRRLRAVARARREAARSDVRHAGADDRACHDRRHRARRQRRSRDAHSDSLRAEHGAGPHLRERSAIRSGRPPPAPELDANSLAATVLRHEGEIAAAVDWLTEVDISTTFGFARRIIALPVGPTGIRGTPFMAHALCEDTGTAPTAPPDSSQRRRERRERRSAGGAHLGEWRRRC
jgi:hypothetical protein